MDWPAFIMSYTPGSSGSIRLRSGRFPSRCSMRYNPSSIWSSTGRERMSILAKLASETLSLFQSMMKRPSMAPGRTGTISGMGELLRTMPPTCWLSSLGASISWGPSSIRSFQPGASTRSRKSGSSSISSRSLAASWECNCLESSFNSSPGSPRALPRSWMIPLTL